jgi:hypothetical protein
VQEAILEPLRVQTRAQVRIRAQLTVEMPEQPLTQEQVQPIQEPLLVEIPEQVLTQEPLVVMQVQIPQVV